MVNNLPEKKAQYRESLSLGMIVDIVLKQDQKTMTLTRGKIKEFLTPKSFHPRGIKVRLEKLGITRLYETSIHSKEQDINYNQAYIEEHYVGRVQRIYYSDHFGVLFLDKNGGEILPEIIEVFNENYKENTCLILHQSGNFTHELLSFFNSINQKQIDIVLTQQSTNLFLSEYKRVFTQILSSLNKNLNVYIYKNKKLLKFEI